MSEDSGLGLSKREARLEARLADTAFLSSRYRRIAYWSVRTTGTAIFILLWTLPLIRDRVYWLFVVWSCAELIDREWQNLLYRRIVRKMRSWRGEAKSVAPVIPEGERG